MKTAAEYQRELDTIVEEMDDETFDAWFGTFSPDHRYRFTPEYALRYEVIRAREAVNVINDQRTPRPFRGYVEKSPNRS